MRTGETTIKVRKRNGQYLCSFPYNSKIVQVMRQLPGGTWHAKEMVWSVPEESIHADELQQKLESIATVTFEIDTGDVSRKITPEHITHYISCIAESGVYSSSYQNIAVNAIKFYIETVCGHKMPTIALIYSAGCGSVGPSV